ncbi:MAG: ATP-binding protein [Lachnospiraceae bacterium]|jgi:hypothetical protein|nr:ATP-binding protein [Lachnospiraceae bacterium]
MGIYLDPGTTPFRKVINNNPYVDKSGMISELNKVINTNDCHVCISRPRRFGKTMAAHMLSAYYSCGSDSADMFAGLEIENDPSFRTHLNKYHVIFLNMARFVSESADTKQMVAMIKERLTREFMQTYPDIEVGPATGFTDCLELVYQATGIGMVVIIDEWDCVFRELQNDASAHKDYLNFLRDFLKDQPYVSLAYMTGILPIKKYGVHSALNMFAEFSMTSPKQFDRFIGFTSEEVKGLCDRYGMDFSEMSAWYDGYRFPHAPSVFSPRSVVAALSSRSFGNYWTRTETYEALKIYIDMGYDGLREGIVRLLAGGRVAINPDRFTNDMVTFTGKDDVMTLLVHLGYLGYLVESGEVFIPNREISGEFVTALESPWYTGIADAVNDSLDLLVATWGADAATVASLIEKAHRETSHLTYNDENALAYTVSLAYYAARQFYTIIREMPSDKGYADMIFLPLRSHPDKPAMVIELKWDQTAQGAIRQIKDRNYPAALEGHAGQLLLVGINYDKDTKTHTCEIESIR